MAGGMDAAFGNQLDSGLIKLKSIAESELQPTGGKVLSISQEEVSGFSYFYMPYSIQISEMSPDIYSNSYQGIYAYLAEDANTVVGSPACFYESWDMESGTTSFRVALASTSSKEGNDAVLKDTFEGGKAIKAIYQGDYEGSGLAHNAIEEYLNSNGLEMNGAAIELYVTGPADEPNASKWITEIIRLRQLDQGIGTGFADLLLSEPLQKAGPTALTTTALAIPHRTQDAPPPDLGLQVEAITDGPGLLDAGQELHRADGVALRIRQIEAEGRGLGHWDALSEGRWCHVS